MLVRTYWKKAYQSKESRRNTEIEMKFLIGLLRTTFEMFEQGRLNSMHMVRAITVSGANHTYHASRKYASNHAQYVELTASEVVRVRRITHVSSPQRPFVINTCFKTCQRKNPVVATNWLRMYTTCGPRAGTVHLLLVPVQNVHVSRFMFTFTFTCKLQDETQREPIMEIKS